MDKFVALPLPDGSLFQLRNLPWPVVEDIEKKHGTSWIYVIDAPQVNGAVLADVVRAVAVVNDLDAPVIDTAADLAAISATLVVVDAAGRPIIDDGQNGADVDGELDRIAWQAN